MNCKWLNEDRICHTPERFVPFFPFNLMPFHSILLPFKIKCPTFHGVIMLTLLKWQHTTKHPQLHLNDAHETVSPGWCCMCRALETSKVKLTALALLIRLMGHWDAERVTDADRTQGLFFDSDLWYLFFTFKSQADQQDTTRRCRARMKWCLTCVCRCNRYHPETVSWLKQEL